MKKYLQIFIATILLVSGTSAYSNSVSVFDNSAAYSATTLGQLFLIDFNSSPNIVVDGSTISGHAIFGSPEASSPSNVVWSSDA